MSSLPPNAPPFGTSSTNTRSSATPRNEATCRRSSKMPCPCVVEVQPPVRIPPRPARSPARGTSARCAASATRRERRARWRRAPRPRRPRRMTECESRLGCLGLTCGAPGASACSGARTGARTSYSTSTRRGGLPGRVAVGRGHRGQHVAHAPDLFALGDEPGPVLLDQPVPPVARHVARGHDRDHARKGRRPGGVDAHDARPGVRRQRRAPRAGGRAGRGRPRRAGRPARSGRRRTAPGDRPRRPRRAAPGSPRPAGRAPSARSRRRSSCSRCSGRGGRRSRGRSPSRVGSGVRSSRYFARSAMPGMQKPHWTPAAAANARAKRSPVRARQPFEREDRPSPAPTRSSSRR